MAGCYDVYENEVDCANRQFSVSMIMCDKCANNVPLCVYVSFTNQACDVCGKQDEDDQKTFIMV